MDPNPENALLVFRALSEFGAQLKGISPEEFARPDLIYQLGMPPSRIDVLTSITGVEFASAWPGKTEARFDDIQIFFIGAEDLIRNKRATARATDLVDCERLEEIRKPKSRNGASWE